MKITAITSQARDPDRVNISIDGAYRFSLDISQVVDLGIRLGKECSEKEIADFEIESQFGKLYARALEYTLLRPHSSREVRDYLWKKTQTTRYRARQTGEIKQREGVSQALADRVFTRLVERGYVDDTKFAKWWIENRNVRKGSSQRKLANELARKGVSAEIVGAVMADSDRNDLTEIVKVIEKKRRRYSDEQKMIAYLSRQGFAYSDIRRVLSAETDD